ncbi:MAG TPA: hypothetical protein VE954_05455 [Oligoflexus sp.]|uniref:hypothetical protein n=1 Tax=Oligoflexus sp. TaxID=1971216 RepID=UPI002D356A28|nr:hypothetical protein [Oligoflexus sp.]HYX32540.1 hypothetical protein [Oligoflexus sp.]
MNRYTLVSFALLTLLSGRAFGHQLYYADSASDEAVALTFCRMGGYANPADCASDIVNNGLIEEAKGCIDSTISQVNKFAITPIAHQVGGNGVPGVWHQNYEHSKEDGLHRHNWSKEAREGAGNTYAAAQINSLKSRYGTVSTTSSHTTTSTGSLGVGGAVGVGVGASVEMSGNAGVSGTSEKGTATEKGPMDQATLDKKWDEYYKAAYDDPQLAGVNPNIYCPRNKPNCVASSGKVIKNESYQPDAPKKEESKPDKSGSSSSPKKPSDTGSSKTPKSSSNDDFGGNSIKTTDGGKWAGEPSKTSDGSMWVDFTQEDPDYDPMALCIFDAHKEKLKGEGTKTYDEGGSADNRSDAQKKRDAEANLKKGLCDEKYYGRQYCANWKKKFELIDSNVPADSKPILEPGEKLERPGFYHYDPDKVPGPKGDTGTNQTPQKLPPHIKP